MILRNGKIGDNVLDRSVFKRVKGAAGNWDSALFSLKNGEAGSPGGEITAAVTCDPITLRTRHAGKLAVHAVVNDLCTQGAVPAAVQPVILMPPGTEEEELRRIVDEIAVTAAAENCTVSGGHTEVTAAVTRCVISMTGIGKIPAAGAADAAPGKKKVCPGMKILMTGWTGLEGTYLLTQECRELLTGFPERFMTSAAAAGEYLSVRKAAEIAAEGGAVLMHDASEGGIMAALWTLSVMTGFGLEIDLKKIAIRQETVEICNELNIDPYKMESAGALLVVLPEENACTVSTALTDAGIHAAVIGEITEGRGKTLVNGEDRACINLPAADSLLPYLG